MNLHFSVRSFFLPQQYQNLFLIHLLLSLQTPQQQLLYPGAVPFLSSQRTPSFLRLVALHSLTKSRETRFCGPNNFCLQATRRFARMCRSHCLLMLKQWFSINAQRWSNIHAHHRWTSSPLVSNASCHMLKFAGHRPAKNKMHCATLCGAIQHISL